MAEEPAEQEIEFDNHVVKLLKKLGTIPDSAKEVFLLDLIRHSASSLYKYRTKCLFERRIEYTEEDPDFVIRVDADKDDKTLSITHKGIGLTKHELKDLIGFIPEDLVNECIDTIDRCLMNGDPKGYYSVSDYEEAFLGIFAAFMVADRVVITTTTELKLKHDSAIEWDAKPRVQYVWDASASDGFFRLTRVDPKAEDQLIKRGSKITVYLKKEYLTYLDETKLRELVDKYTFHDCPYPIYVSAEHEREKKRQRMKVREEELQGLKKDFEGLRELCVHALASIKSHVELVVVDDRVSDLPAHVSNNGKTFVINPRSPKLKSLLEEYNKNPGLWRKKKMVMDRFIKYFHVYSAPFIFPPWSLPPRPLPFLPPRPLPSQERTRARTRTRTRRMSMRMSMRMMIEGSRRK